MVYVGGACTLWCLQSLARQVRVCLLRNISAARLFRHDNIAHCCVDLKLKRRSRLLARVCRSSLQRCAAGQPPPFKLDC